MNKSLWKGNLREIIQSLPRFLSIFSIIALGVAFFIGIRASGPTMVSTARKIYEDYNLPDGKILSNLGLSKSDIIQLKEQEGIEWAPMRSINVVIDPSQETMKLFTYNGDSNQNFYAIQSGRMLEAPNEIILDSKFVEVFNQELSDPIEIGDTVTLSQSNDAFDLEITNFEVVGFARTPYFIERISRENGATVFGVVDEDVIQGDIYTEAYFWLEEAAALPAYSPEYEAVVTTVVAELEEVIEPFAERRFTDLETEISEEIVDGQSEIAEAYEALQSGQAQLSDTSKLLAKAPPQLAEAELALLQGQKELRDGQEEFQDGLGTYREGRLQWLDGQAKLQQGFRLYRAGVNDYQQALAEFRTAMADAEADLVAGQAELDSASQSAQAAMAPLLEIQAGINQALTALAQGRQALLDSLPQEVSGSSATAELIKQLQQHSNQLTATLELLKQLNNETGLEELSALIDALVGEANLVDTASQTLAENNELLAQIPTTLTIGEILSDEIFTQYSQILMTEITPATAVSEVIIANNEAQTYYQEQLANDEIYRTKVTELDQLKAREEEIPREINRLEGEIQSLEAEMNNPNPNNGVQLTSQAAAEIQRLEGELASFNSQLSAQQETLQQLTPEAVPTERPLIEEQISNTQAQIANVQAQIAGIRADTTNYLAPSPPDHSQVIADKQAQMQELATELPLIQAEILAGETWLNNNQQLPLSPEESASIQAQLAYTQQMEESLAEAAGQFNEGQMAREQILQGNQAILTALSENLSLLNQEVPSELPSSPESQAALAQLAQAQAEIDQGWETLNEQRSQAQAQLDQAQAALAESNTEIRQGQQELFQARQEAFAGKADLDEAQQLLDDGWQEIAEGEARLLDERRNFLVGQAQFLNGEAEFNEEALTAVADLRKGQLEIAEGQASLADLSQPTYNIIQMANNISYQSVKDNADQLTVISNIFPVFFLAIAILVTFTTIQRMASEQRNYMGTMKQMGYPNASVLSKFTIYAGLASFLGIILGLFIGYLIFPGVVVNAYNILYYFEEPQIRVLWPWNVIVTIVAMFAAMLPAIYTPMQALREAPSLLLVPKAPKAGKKLFLERFSHFWNRISFKAKLTIRNLLRYKGRNFMTFLGVAGCTMLIVTGFGISDTISGIVSLQFDEIQRYDAMVYLSHAVGEIQTDNLARELEELPGVASVYPMQSETLEILLPSGQSQEIQVLVPMADYTSLNQFLTFRQRGEAPQDLLEGKPLVTERLQELLNLTDGAEIVIQNEDYEQFVIEDVTIIENYVGHNLYLSPSDYQENFGEMAETNMYYLQYNQTANINQTNQDILGQDDFIAIFDVQAIAAELSNTMESLDLITIILIISAAALSFIVLYNLTNINVSERIKELSTFKVLGFYNHEVSMYIFYEVIVLTILGSLSGLLLGRFLTAYLMKTMQMANVLFYPQVARGSYIIAFVLSFVFSSMVMLAMHFKLRKIDMVEALKGVD